MASGGETAELKRFTLPGDVKPSHYDLTLEPDLEKFVFAGRCEITVEVQKPTSSIVVNASELSFKEVTVAQGSNKYTVPTSDLVLDAEHGRVTVKVPEQLNAGPATLLFEYDGELNDQTKGFYRAKYQKLVEGEKVDRFMVSTQFEAADARRALPCWDEPARKATFDVTLIIPNELTGLSNMPVKSDQPHPTDASKKVLKFDRSPVMSTYLLAFAVGEFTYLESTVKKVHSGQDTVIRLYATDGQEEKGKLAMEAAERCLPLYENFFGTDFILPKVDLIGIPNFASGAMENWGLITFRESCLLCDKEQSSYRTKLFVALVVCHELAHMWFGNLVTMEWWKELWLNESFATFLEYDSVDKLYPEWQAWAQFVALDFDSALSLDALITSHPVEVDVAHAHEIDEIFDDISYAKGCSIMRMVVTWIGFDNFQRAMQSYMKQFQFRNATTVDLWNALEKASQLPVIDVMSAWTACQGYPVLLVSELENGEGIRIRQQRFLSQRLPTPEEDNVIWKIPVLVLTNEGETRHLIEEKETVIKFEKPVEWVKLNAGQTSVCRVGYSPSLRERLSVKAIVPQVLSNVDQTGIISDAAALAIAGQLPATAVLELSKSFGNCRDMTALNSLSGALGEVFTIMRGTGEKEKEAMELFGRFEIKVFEPVAKELGWDHKEGDSDRTKQLRGLVTSRLAQCNHTEALAEARKRVEKLIKEKDENALAQDLRVGAYRAYVKFGGRQEWEAMKAFYESATDPSEKSRSRSALASTRDEELLKETLEYVMSDSVKSQDMPSLLSCVAANCFGTRLHETFVVANLDKIFAKVGAGVLYTHVIGAFCYHLNEADCERIKKWWETVDSEKRRGADRSMSQALESVAVNAAFRSRDFANVLNWLKTNCH